MACTHTNHHVYNSFALFLISFISCHFISANGDFDTYIVHMDKSSMPKAFATHHSWYLATLRSATEQSSRLTASSDTGFDRLVYSYENVVHGFSAVLSSSELEVLQSMPGYVSSTRDLPVKPDTTRTAQFLGLNADHGIWPASNYGKDVIIGVIDTGVWPESKSFSDTNIGPIPSRWKGACQVGTQFNTSNCNKKLIGAKYFNRGIVAKVPNATISINSTRDTDGHGTHTSSTAAGSRVPGASYLGYATGTSQGMAPLARIAMYKALWEIGSQTSDIIAAIDEAINDGVDVLTMSLGVSGVPLYQDPIAIATFAAIEKGIFVATSAGNEGPGLASVHNGTPWVLTVAAGTVDRNFHGNVILGNGVSVPGQTLYPGTNSSTSPIPIVLVGVCDEKSLLKIRHKIVVCVDATSEVDDFNDQVYAVKHSKVAGGIFITNITDLEYYMVSSFPATFVNLENGEMIKKYIKKSPKSAKGVIKFQKTTLETKPAPQVADYSSRGPSSSCPSVLKPDLMGPGAQILASWPDKVPVTDVNSKSLYSKFNILSGTSMSCPHAAGVAALLVAAHPDWTPAAIRSSMMTTTDILDNSGKPISDIGMSSNPATPIAMGSGHINPNKALNPGLIYETGTQDYINLLCKLNFTSKQIQTITRTSWYTCSKKSKTTFDLNYPSFIAYYDGSGTKPGPVQEFIRTVTNVGSSSASYTAKITPIIGFELTVMPDKLVFSGKNEKKEFKLRIRGPVEEVDYLRFGYLSWVEDSGQYLVRSPIVVTSIIMDEF